MPGEETNDYVITDQYKKFEVEIYKIIINQAVNSTEKRFESNKNIYEDFSLVDPLSFARTTKNNLISSDNQKLLRLAQNINVNPADLRNELLNFIEVFSTLERVTTD